MRRRAGRQANGSESEISLGGGAEEQSRE